MNTKQTLLAGAVVAIGLSVLVAPSLGFLGAGDAAAQSGNLECSVLPQSICDAAENPRLDQSGVWGVLILVVNIMTAGVAIAAVGAIAFAGFLYATAQNDTNQTKKALEMIRNTVIGIVVYALFFAGVNFLVPGGVFGTRVDDNPPIYVDPECRPGEPC